MFKYFSSLFIIPLLCTIPSFLHLDECGQGRSTVQMKATLGLSPVAAFSSLILHFPVTKWKPDCVKILNKKCVPYFFINDGPA